MITTSSLAEKAKVSNITSKAGGQVFTCLIQALIQAGRHNVHLKRQFDLKMVNATTLPATCHVGATSEVTTHLPLKPLIIQYPPPHTHTPHSGYEGEMISLNRTVCWYVVVFSPGASHLAGSDFSFTLVFVLQSSTGSRIFVVKTLLIHSNNNNELRLP